MKKFAILLFFISSLTLFFSCNKTEKEKTPVKENKVIKGPSVALDACSMIDKSEIEKILNIKMKEPKEGKSQDGAKDNISFSECSYESDSGDSKIFLSIYIRFSPFKEDALTALQSVRNSFKQSGIQVYNVEGIGDVAFWGGSQLHVFIGDNYYIIITLLGLRERDDAIDKAKAIALQVSKNLKQN
jgi:hypothetical protein